VNKKSPLISCICITRNRPDLLARAIKLFKLQSYAKKELVIIYREDDWQTSSLLKELSPAGLLLVEVPKSQLFNLGQLRNLGIEQCNGELICCWDDDDWHHFRRLEVQFAVIRASGFKGCVLTKILITDVLNKQAYYSHERLWEGTLMCYRSVFLKRRYADLKKGEDFELVSNLHSENLLYRINTVPNLYIYNYHGANTWSIDHFKFFFARSEPLSEKTSAEIVGVMNSSDIERIDSLKIDFLIDNQIFDWQLKN